MNRVKCFTDIHLHLDGSISVESAKRLAELQNITIPSDDNSIRALLEAGENCRNLNDFLTKFDFPLSLLQTKEGLRMATSNLLAELEADGCIYTEIRFAPQLHMKRGLSFDEIVQSVVDGLADSKIKSQVILCCMRGSDTKEMNFATIDVAERFLGRGVCAIDLAGAEGIFPTKDYEDIFVYASKKNIPFTIHAGEADGAESVKKAIEFGAKRIGHGVRAIEDPEVLSILRKNKIALELCPTSNLCTCVFEKLSDYPIRKLMENGIVVTINTDDMVVCGTNIRNEYEKIVREFRLTEEEILELLYNSVDVSFVPDEEKEKLKIQIKMLKK